MLVSRESEVRENLNSFGQFDLGLARPQHCSVLAVGQREGGREGGRGKRERSYYSRQPAADAELAGDASAEIKSSFTRTHLCNSATIGTTAGRGGSSTTASTDRSDKHANGHRSL